MDQKFPRSHFQNLTRRKQEYSNRINLKQPPRRAIRLADETVHRNLRYYGKDEEEQVLEIDDGERRNSMTVSIISIAKISKGLQYYD